MRETETERGREGTDSLTVNSLWSLHRINGVRLDRQCFCIKIWHILPPDGPLGTTGITDSDMDLGICIKLRAVKAFPPHRAGAKPERTGLQTSFPKSMFYDITVRI